MLIRGNGLDYYLRRMRKSSYFAQVGYSDAEWYCMVGARTNRPTGLGQIISEEHGRRLLEVMQRRQSDPSFIFAVPSILPRLPVFAKRYNDLHNPDRFLAHHNIKLQFYERDRITDDLARDAGLFSLIQQLRNMDTVLIGPKELEAIDFLGSNHQHISINSPNLHLEEEGIEDAVVRAMAGRNDHSVFLVSAGVSAPIIIDRLYDSYLNSFFFDCGSIWDAFVGIGGQREWRAKLYENPEALERWKHDNLNGKPRN